MSISSVILLVCGFEGSTNERQQLIRGERLLDQDRRGIQHAVMGNLAYLAGTHLARWEIWDGMRAVDYLLTRPEVDAERISITRTSSASVMQSPGAAHRPSRASHFGSITSFRVTTRLENATREK